MREGKAVSQVEGRIIQGGEPRLVCLASFGGDRQSAVEVAPTAAPEATPVDQCQALPYIQGVTPEFTQHIEMRWGIRSHAVSRAKGGREMGGWMQFSGKRQRPFPTPISWPWSTPGHRPCCHT